ncbi:MAG: heme exporter protein CcmD [Pseudomonadota bacterium]
MLGDFSHEAFVALSYGVTALALGGLFVWLLVVGRARQRRIEALEAMREGRRGG